MQRFVSFYFPVIAWMGIIYYLSSIPNLAVSSGGVDQFLRSGAHGAEYLVLTLLMYRLLITSINWQYSSFQTVLLSTVLAILYALTDEWHQSTVPTRSGNVFDVLLDSAGAVVGALFIYYGHLDTLIFGRRNKESRA